MLNLQMCIKKPQESDAEVGKGVFTEEGKDGEDGKEKAKCSSRETSIDAQQMKNAFKRSINFVSLKSLQPCS